MTKGILGLGVVVVMLLRVTAASAEPPCDTSAAITIDITCKGDECVVIDDPEHGSVVQIGSVAAPLGARLYTVYWRGWWELSSGSTICTWQGPQTLKVFVPLPAIEAFDGEARDESWFAINVYEGKPTPRRGDELDDQFLDVVRVGPTCTGIVVGARHVLTAAHCMNAKWVEGRGGRRMTVFDRIQEPTGADAALLAVTVGDSLGLPIRSRSKSPSDKPATGRVHIVGYGATDASGTLGGGARNHNETSVRYWTCDEDRAATLSCRPGIEVVIAGGGSDACNGDSGGPILDRFGDHWRLIGITSRAVPSDTACGNGGIYTHVGALAAWIESEIAREESNP